MQLCMPSMCAWSYAYMRAAEYVCISVLNKSRIKKDKLYSRPSTALKIGPEQKSTCERNRKEMKDPASMHWPIR